MRPFLTEEPLLALLWRLGEGLLSMVEKDMARPGTAEEVAKSIVWLCSEDASYCTDKILDVAGGR